MLYNKEANETAAIKYTPIIRISKIENMYNKTIIKNTEVAIVNDMCFLKTADRKKAIDNMIKNNKTKPIYSPLFLSINCIIIKIYSQHIKKASIEA